MVLGKDITIVRHIEIPEAFISLRSDDIVHVHYKKNTVLDVELQLRMRRIFDEVTGARRLKFIFSGDEGFILTKEARENISLRQKESPILAYAIIAHNLGYKIVANFYIKVVKPKGHYRVFNKLDEAIAWLYSF